MGSFFANSTLCIIIIRGEERIVPEHTLRSNKMVFGNNHAYQRGQEDQNKILTDHFLFFIIIESLRVHLGRSERHGQRHRRCPPTARNCDHNAPLSPWRACDRIKGDVSAPFARTDRVMSFPGRIVRWSGCWAKSRGNGHDGKESTVSAHRCSDPS